MWLFLHSGSRGVGNRIAQKHIDVARRQCEQWWIDLPHRDLAYLVEGDPEFWAYIREMRWAQHYALLNREEMMDRVVACFGEWVGAGDTVERVEEINCHHNYTEQERHFGKQVWLSRKGAINAEIGRPGLIPGSMGTASYVVEGKGNALSLCSAPHGAGREYSRTAARKRFTREQLRESMVGHRVPRHRCVHRRDPGGVQGHRPGDGRRRATSSPCATRCGRSSTSRATDRHRSRGAAPPRTGLTGSGVTVRLVRHGKAALSEARRATTTRDDEPPVGPTCPVSAAVALAPSPLGIAEIEESVDPSVRNGDVANAVVLMPLRLIVPGVTAGAMASRAVSRPDEERQASVYRTPARTTSSL